MLGLLLEKINTDRMDFPELFAQFDPDDLLELRDEAVFDAEWMGVFRQLEKLSYREADLQIINEIRKQSYLKAYQATNSGELAACVSDDFELVAKAYVSSVDNTWLNAVILCYADGRFPCGEMMERTGSIADTFSRLVK